MRWLNPNVQAKSCFNSNFSATQPKPISIFRARCISEASNKGGKYGKNDQLYAEQCMFLYHLLFNHGIQKIFQYPRLNPHQT